MTWARARNSVGIDRLAVRLRSTDASPGPAIGQDVARMLGNADLHPGSLGHAEVLLVRGLAGGDALVLTPAALHADREWANGLRARLEDIAAHAARPIDGLVDGDPVALRFGDFAEMLACFALAVARGEAWRQWWWRSWLRAGALPGVAAGMPPALIWRALAAERPTAVAGSLTQLLAWRRFMDTASLWEALGAEAVLRLIAQATPEVARWLPLSSSAIGRQTGARSGGTEEAQTAHPQARRATVGSVSRSANASSTLIAIPAGLRADLAAVWDGTRPDSELRPLALLAGLAAMAPARLADAALPALISLTTIDRAPGDDRGGRSSHGSAAGGHQVAVLADAVLGEGPANNGGGQGAGEPMAQARGADRQGAAPSQPGDALDVDRGAVGDPDSPPARKSGAGGAGRADIDINASGVASGVGSDGRPQRAPAAASALAEEVTGPGNAGRVGHDAPAQSATSARQTIGVTEAAPVRAGALHVETSLAGVFYLINLPEGGPEGGHVPPPASSRWAILEVLARDLCAQAGIANAATDPVWRALAWLDGRDDLDTPPAPPPNRPHRPSRSLEMATPAAPGAVVEVLGPAWQPWLPLLRDHAITALSHTLPGEPGDAIRTVLSAVGQIHLTRTHVDVYMSLQAIAMPLRVAGLDRDPGWRADYGRVVQFHFG